MSCIVCAAEKEVTLLSCANCHQDGDFIREEGPWPEWYAFTVAGTTGSTTSTAPACATGWVGRLLLVDLTG